jgi:hypothetical protein
MRAPCLLQRAPAARGLTPPPSGPRYIGGWPKSREVLPPAHDLSVVDVTCELPRTHETGGRYLCLPTWGAAAGRAGVGPGQAARQRPQPQLRPGCLEAAAATTPPAGRALASPPGSPRAPPPAARRPPDTHAPEAPEIQAAVEWAQTELRAGREVYVHCAHGHGRSATVLAAILIADGQAKGADDAVKLMRCARSWGCSGPAAHGLGGTHSRRARRW